MREELVLRNCCQRDQGKLREGERREKKGVNPQGGSERGLDKLERSRGGERRRRERS